VRGRDRTDLRLGAFTEVTVPVASAAAAAVLPQTAVRPTERGFVAYVVDDGLAKERVLTLGLRTPAGDIEIRAGVEPGEMAVVRGGEALFDGAEVEIEKPAGETAAKPRAENETLLP
jgi:multidrug efflux system membrane fusion protein